MPNEIVNGPPEPFWQTREQRISSFHTSPFFGFSRHYFTNTQPADARSAGRH
jgi:hypothetical protein